MMTPKMKEDFCTQILGASRQLFLSGRISEICREKGTQKTAGVSSGTAAGGTNSPG